MGAEYSFKYSGSQYENQNWLTSNTKHIEDIVQESDAKHGDQETKRIINCVRE